jgi:hypothetical protein
MQEKDKKFQEELERRYNQEIADLQKSNRVNMEQAEEKHAKLL